MTLAAVISNTGLYDTCIDFSTFQLTLQAAEGTKSRSASSFILQRLELPVICHRGTGTLHPELSGKVFYLVWVNLGHIYKHVEQKDGRLVPSPHIPGPLSSFPSGSAALWCTVAPHFPPAAAWCVWSVWSGTDKEEWRRAIGLMKAANIYLLYDVCKQHNKLSWQIFMLQSSYLDLTKGMKAWQHIWNQWLIQNANGKHENTRADVHLQPREHNVFGEVRHLPTNYSIMATINSSRVCLTMFLVIQSELFSGTTKSYYKILKAKCLLLCLNLILFISVLQNLT